MGSVMNHNSEFCCHLDGQPDHLTPDHLLLNDWAEHAAGHPLFLNKSCQLTDNGELPRELAQDAWLTDGFASMKDMAWVRNPATGAVQPFWLKSQTHSLLTDIQDGKPISSMAEHQRCALAMAGVLVPDNYEEIHQQKLTAVLSRCAEQVMQRGYAPAAGLIHPFHISAMRRYYRKLVRTGNLPLGDSQSSRRYFAHNESVARFFHFQLTGAVSAIMGETVKPSYVSFASYQEGA